MKRVFYKFLNWLQKLSFKTGLIVLGLCVPCYILAFIPFAFDMDYVVKGILWFVFFGLAKTFQYTGLTILGVEGVRRLKLWWRKFRNKELTEIED